MDKVEKAVRILHIASEYCRKGYIYVDDYCRYEDMVIKCLKDYKGG